MIAAAIAANFVARPVWSPTDVRVLRQSLFTAALPFMTTSLLAASHYLRVA
jgi:hypothetical protein